MNRFKKLFLAFGVLLVTLICPSNTLESGECETINPKTENKTIIQCCKGFMKSPKSGKCIPMCLKVCRNSFCIGNNKCKCKEGFHQISDHECVPKCDNPKCGEDMRCVSPNICMCKSQYRKVNESFCEPICSFGEDNFECTNARCVAPNLCECLDGYTKYSEHLCEPVCTNCENGQCTEPEQCECNEGYEKNSEGICSPVCQTPCINSKCIKPNICQCENNFERLNANECVRIQTYENSKCNKYNCQRGTCNEKGDCLCPLNYELHNGKCEEICNLSCGNGKCLGNRCICNEGYRSSENGTFCNPVCAFEDDHDCIEGICIAPQVCQCFEGFKFLDSRNCTCVPMCNPSCIHGICTKEGCKCHEGFFEISEFECQKNCSEGYIAIGESCVEATDYTEIFGNNEDEDEHKTTKSGDENELETTENDNEDEDDYDSESSTTISEDSSSSVSTLVVNDGVFEIPSSSIATTTTEEINEVEQASVLISDMIPTTLVITILIITIILILIILCMYWRIYHRLNSKYSYNVHERESNSNCVYFNGFENGNVTHVEHCL